MRSSRRSPRSALAIPARYARRICAIDRIRYSTAGNSRSSRWNWLGPATAIRLGVITSNVAAQRRGPIVVEQWDRAEMGAVVEHRMGRPVDADPDAALDDGDELATRLTLHSERLPGMHVSNRETLCCAGESGSTSTRRTVRGRPSTGGRRGGRVGATTRSDGSRPGRGLGVDGRRAGRRIEGQRQSWNRRRTWRMPFRVDLVADGNVDPSCEERAMPSVSTRTQRR